MSTTPTYTQPTLTTTEDTEPDWLGGTACSLAEGEECEACQ